MAVSASAERKIKGIADLDHKLTELQDKVRGSTLRNAARHSMKPVQEKASQMAPVAKEPHKTHKGRLVAPGFLSRNIRRTTKLSKDKQAVKGSVTWRPEAFYGKFFELPVSRHGSHPFLRPAFYKNRSEIERRFAEQLKKKIEQVAKS